MAGANLCVSCAALPIKERGVAVKRQRCPQCTAVIGVTTYGAHFRVPAARWKFTSPTVLTGMILAAGAATLVIVLVAVPLWIEEKAKPILRPVAATPADVPDDLARVTEISLEDPFPRDTHPAEAKQRLQRLVLKIKNENAAKQDGYLLAQMDRRKELRGMPFIMGDACRLKGNSGNELQTSVTSVREALDQAKAPATRLSGTEPHTTFWNTYLATKAEDKAPNASLAALSQILGPEHQSLRSSLVDHLSRVNGGPEATRLLARAAIFDSAADVRNAAIKALKDRKPEEYSEVLMTGIRYPMPVIAKRAAVAMILLKRNDMLAPLTEFLGEAAPGDPMKTVVNDQEVHAVREVVRVNHHRNCLMCHAPTEGGTSAEVPGLIPTPGMPFPTVSREYYGDVLTRGEPSVRADTTYLRQDFSVMMPVANAAPWPEMQRFDFLVRARVVEGAELAALQHKVSNRPAGYLSENHQAALRVLRELSGQDAEPTQVAWQRVLGINPAE